MTARVGLCDPNPAFLGRTGGRGDSRMQLHATTVALNGQGLLILGPSGSGKSTLALELMAVRALLVADDRTDLRLADGRVMASAPQAIRGRIEARGIGILRAGALDMAPLHLVVDLGHAEEDRLPQSRTRDLLGMPLPLVFGPYRPHLYAALRQMMLFGRAD